MKKILSLLLAAVMLGSVLVSCGGEAAVTTEAPAVTTAPAETEKGNDSPNLPDAATLDIDGEFYMKEVVVAVKCNLFTLRERYHLGCNYSLGISTIDKGYTLNILTTNKLL